MISEAIPTLQSPLKRNTPGEILENEYLKPMSITQYRLAKDIGVPPGRINQILKGRRAITADTALRLGIYFRMSPEFWLNVQSHHDLDRERERLAERLDKEVKVPRSARVDAHETSPSMRVTI
ncbi:MAG TPA: HigA family addiction module antitoxin [Verrucomicrobiae bacterium]|jgi:addiction module HigA family antidote